MKCWRLGFIALAAFAIATSAIALLTVPQWLLPLTRSVLHHYAVDLQTIDIGQINRHHATFTNISIDYPPFSIQAPTIEFDYQISELLDSKIDRIHIPRLHVTLMQPATPSNETPFNISALFAKNWLPQSWLPRLPFSALQIDDLQLQLLKQTLHGALDFADQQVSITLTDDNTQLQCAALLQSDNQIQLELNRQQQSLLSVQSQLTPPLLKGEFSGDVASLLQLADDLQLFKSPFDVSGNIKGQWQFDQHDWQHATADWQFNGNLTLPSDWPTYGLTSLALQAQGKMNTQQINADLQAQDPTKLLNVSGQLQHQLTDTTGTLKLQFTLPAFQESLVFLPKLLPTFPYPIDFSGGELNINSDIDWNRNEFHATHHVAAHHLQGFYQRMLFNEVNTDINITQSNSTPLQLNANQVTIGNIDSGVLINNLSFALQANPQQIIINNLHADLFGGKLRHPQIIYDIATNSSAFELQLENLQLGELLKLQQRITGNGMIDGRLPIRIRNNDISISKGTLQSRAPGGLIQLQSDQATSSAHPDLQLAMGLLENFQFTDLNAQLDYFSVGDLKMQTHFSGRNLQWQQGRTVNFNLALNQNIPALLQSLQLSQNLSEKLEQRIKALYKP
jgi:hypothetical protein